MIEFVKESLWKHFGASIDMLSNAIAACPDAYWHSNRKFFYTAYHTTVFLDYYLTIPPNDFFPLLPYTLTMAALIPAEAIDDVVPDRMYSKEELVDYVKRCREKCRALITSLTPEKLKESWIAGQGTMNLDLSGQAALGYPVLEILLYNMKHVQHHVAQLNLLLRGQTNNVPDYVSHVSDPL